MDAIAFWAAASSISINAIRAPWRAKPATNAAPIPDAPPVISTRAERKSSNCADGETTVLPLLILSFEHHSLGGAWAFALWYIPYVTKGKPLPVKIILKESRKDGHWVSELEKRLSYSSPIFQPWQKADDCSFFGWSKLLSVM
ncbi:hypothetical protein [Rhizobium sp. FKL33]|uniref:hypothetical protein n=1 Tax=Rhizobium sp. FKL33 TaxID=2562307 RepID=UPI001FF01628|nr:hypothetical protein [Rhizobium sp. FKL33]